MIDFGANVRARRGTMGLSLEALARELGGSPGQTFLSKIERGVVGVNPELASRLARALRVPEPILLNGAGHATSEQVDEALKVFERLVSEPAPQSVLLPLVDLRNRIIGERRRLMSQAEDAFLVEFSDIKNEPFVGECLVLTKREPVHGIGVVVEIEGELSAWTYHDQPGMDPWLQNGRKEKRAAGYKILGIIARVAVERVFTE